MTYIELSEKAGRYLQRLCVGITNRCVGSKGNRKATEFFEKIVASFGFQTEYSEFDCIDWTHGEVHLDIDGEPFEAFSSPYSLGCHLSAPLTVASTVDELDAIGTSKKILLLRGEIAKEQLMPKNFTFYNPDQHKRIIHLLEKKNPAAIIAATTRNPELAGGMYPFPLIEDGDFNIPSVYMTEEEGERLEKYVGKEISLKADAKRIPSRSGNVIARKGIDSERRIVLCAHIDAKINTPGALDNASGIVVLLLLAELMGSYSGDVGVEIVALNGEDYYSAPGQVQYLKNYQGRLNEIKMSINLDGAGYYKGNTEYSLYECPNNIAASVRKEYSSYKDIVEGEPWYQSDHMIFVMNQVPSVAITSERFMEISTFITHTSKDSPELVDIDKLVSIALSLRNLVYELDRILK